MGLQSLCKQNIFARFEETYKDLWTQNGNSCSMIYAGTGAIEGKSKVPSYMFILWKICVGQNRFCFDRSYFDVFHAGYRRNHGYLKNNNFQLRDASRSVARTIQNNLMDGTKQEVNKFVLKFFIFFKMSTNSKFPGNGHVFVGHRLDDGFIRQSFGPASRIFDAGWV